MSAAALGFDVGGQSVKAVLVSADGEVLARGNAPTGEDTTIDSLADSLLELRRRLLADAQPDAATGGAVRRVAGRARPLAAGIGLAGALDRGGFLRGSPHLPRLVGERVGAALSARLSAPVAVHNDADCAAVAEGWRGAARGCDDFLTIAIGTGVGSGLVLGGRLRAGASGYGCELGHMMVVHGGRRCGCGNAGCLEAYISETAARGLVDEAPAALRARVEARREAFGGGAAEALFALGAAGDADAEALAGRMVDVLGAAVGSVVNVLDLTTVVLGGGIAPGVLARRDRLLAAAAGNLFARPASALAIVAASCGPEAGAVGAARLGMLSL